MNKSRKSPLVLLLLHMLSCCFANSVCDSFGITARDCSLPYSHCESWRINAERNNLRNWRIPSGCENYVSNYVLGEKYRLDIEAVCKEAKSYAETVRLEGDGKDAWILDIDEAALSNVAYYVGIQFGLLPFTHATWVEWEMKAIAPAIEPMLSLYRQLLTSQWSLFFLTGRHEIRRNATIENLVRSGYQGWADVIFRQDGDSRTTAEAFKSTKRLELQEQGYRIWGNIGDQWSDLTGHAAGERAFKIPNPMYYLP